MPAHPVLYVTADSGDSFKPVLVARQTHRALTLRYVDVLAGETRSKGFLKINPRGVVPYMLLADGRGLGESNALAWYLAEDSALMPSDAVSRAQAIQWMLFEQTALEPNIAPARFYTHIAPHLLQDHAHELPSWRERGERALRALDTYLKGRDFITDAGYSVADVAVYGCTHLADEGGFDLARHPHVGAWMERVQGTPGYASMAELLAPGAEAALTV